MKTLVNNQNIESKNQVFNAIVEAIKGDKMIGRHIAESYGLNGPRPVYGIEVWESIVYVHTDTDRRIFDKAIDRLLKAHTDLFKWADFQKEAEDGPHIVLALTDQAVEWKKIVETPESVRDYISKIKAEAMARVPYKKGDRIKDNQGQEGFVLDVSPNIWWNNYGVPYIMSQWGMVTNPKHFNPNDPNDQPDVDARVQLDNGKIWAGGYHLYHPVATLETASEITDGENKAVMENVSDMSNDELLAMVANELENGGKQDEPGARFKIGDRVRMKHDGATGTIARVWDGYDGFSYEVTRDVPIEGLEPGSEVWEAFPPEKGLEPLEPASEITDVPAADLCWDVDEEGVKVWGNIERHADNLKRMGAKRGRVVFKSNRTGLPQGADCYVLTKDSEDEVRQYIRKTHERISHDFSEAREKYGQEGHEYREGEKVVTIYGRGTVIKTDCWHQTDLIDVRLDLPTYNYIWSLLGTPQSHVAVSREQIVSIELPEPPKEVVLQDTSEIKAVCIEGVSLTAEKRQKWVKNFGDIIREHTTMGKETQYNHDCGCIRVTVAYRNDSDKPEDWTYCVAWYRWLDIVTEKRELVECENGVRLEQAARAMADFHLLADAGLSLRQILYPAA